MYILYFFPYFGSLVVCNVFLRPSVEGLQAQMAVEPGLSGVWAALRQAGRTHLAVVFLQHGVRRTEDVPRLADVLLSTGLVAQTDLEAVLAVCTASTAPSVDSPQGRWDHPIQRDFSARASFTLALQAASPNNRKRSLEALQDDILSKSSAPAQESRVRTYKALCAAWEVAPFPVSPESIRCTGASFKAGHYRSVQLYYQAVFGFQLRHLGVPVDPLIRGTVREVVRSVKRGLGPSRLKEGFDVWLLSRSTFSDDDEAFNLSSAVHCIDMVIIGVWWMLREIEMSSAMVQHLWLEHDRAHLLVPVHKTESCGNLMPRALGCACSSTPSRLCPWHSVERHLTRVYNHACFRPQSQFPLFPDERGRPASKARMIEAFQLVIGATGTSLTKPDERGQHRTRFGGHTLRVSGAQFLAGAGVPLQHIQLLGRWSSMAVQRYVQCAPLSVIPNIPETILSGQVQDLQEPLRVVNTALREPDPAASQPAFSPGTPSGIAMPVETPQVLQQLGQSLASTDGRLQQLADTVSSLQQAVLPPEQTFVVRSKSRVVHHAQPDELANHPSSWRTRCGWLYGQANFYRLSVVAPEHKQCKKCFNLVGSDRDGHDDHGDESATDSSDDSSSEDSSADEPS